MFKMYWCDLCDVTKPCAIDRSRAVAVSWHQEHYSAPNNAEISLYKIWWKIQLFIKIRYRGCYLISNSGLLCRCLPQITQYWCNYIKLAEIGNRTVTMSTFSWVLLENAKDSSFYSPKAGPIGKRDTQTRTDGHTDRRTDEQTSNSGDPLHKRP